MEHTMFLMNLWNQGRENLVKVKSLRQSWKTSILSFLRRLMTSLRCGQKGWHRIWRSSREQFLFFLRYTARSWRRYLVVLSITLRSDLWLARQSSCTDLVEMSTKEILTKQWVIFLNDFNFLKIFVLQNFLVDLVILAIIIGVYKRSRIISTPNYKNDEKIQDEIARIRRWRFNPTQCYWERYFWNLEGETYLRFENSLYCWDDWCGATCLVVLQNGFTDAQGGGGITKDEIFLWTMLKRIG